MAIKINVSPQITFKVRGTVTNEAGAAQAVDFDLIARRMDADELQAAWSDGSRKTTDFMADVVTGWRRVLDDSNAEVPFSAEAMAMLFKNHPGIAGLAYKQYLADVGAKEKN